MPIERRGRSRWKLPFGRSSTAAPSSPAASVGNGSTPMSFLCPISSSLMADPVIIPTGHTFERACIEACREFKFTPPCLIIPSSSNIDDYFSSSSSSFLIPNAALRAAIFDWCDHAALPRPSPISRESARALVQNLISNSKSPPPPPKFQQQIAVEIEIEEEEDYATNNKNKNKQQQQQFSSPPSNSSSCSTCSTSSFSSSERDQIHLTTTRTPYSSSASSSNNNISSSSDPLEESILIKLKSPQISVKESGLITLRQSARESSDSRISLCTPRILAALVPMILFSTGSSSSSNNNSSTNATAALVNLSIEPANKVKIVRSGAIPPLVEALKKKPGRYCEEARYNAAGALFSLSLEDENKLAIGVLGAIPPLINLFCEESAGDVARVEAGMALYHLSLAPNNLSKIAKTPGAVKAILNMAVAATAKGEIESSEETATRMLSLRLRRVGMMVLASLARRNEGRVALMDADAVKAMVGLMMESAAGREEEEYCLAVMYEMSKGKGSLRFRALARAAGAERVLLHGNDDAAARGEVGKEMVRRILKVIRGDHEGRGVYNVVMMLGDEEEEEQEVEEVASVVSDGLVSFRRRRYDDFGGTSTTNSANF